MFRQIAERDWKVLRDLKPLALDRFCERVLGEMTLLANDADKGAHARYLAVYKLLMDRDEELAAAFNGLRRSTALLQLTIMRRHGLITDEEMAQFSQDTREAVEMILGGP